MEKPNGKNQMENASNQIIRENDIPGMSPNWKMRLKLFTTNDMILTVASFQVFQKLQSFK
jgi:hypothetical protein